MILGGPAVAELEKRIDARPFYHFFRGHSWNTTSDSIKPFEVLA